MKPSYSPAQLQKAISKSENWNQVSKHLNLSPNGYTTLQRYAALWELDTSSVTKRQNERISWDEIAIKLPHIVPHCVTLAEVLSCLGIKCSGDRGLRIRKLCEENGISIAHFVGRGWNRGKTKDTDPRLISKTKIPDELVLVENSPYKISTHGMRQRLLSNGMEYKCAGKNCSISTEWLGSPIVLHIDHIDGDRTNNRITNLRFLCPNCHSQTETFGAKNMKRKNSIHPQGTSMPRGNKRKSKACLRCEISTTNSKYCSLECAKIASRRSKYSASELKSLYDEIGSFEGVGRHIGGLTGASVKKRLKKAGLV